jgi:GT2 family glycosyltransferase
MVYIVLVNWKGWKDTIECLESLLRLANQEFRVIVCDNNSQNSSIEKILSWSRGEQPASLDGPPWTRIGAASPRRREPSVQVIGETVGSLANPSVVTIVEIKENRGFAGGCNVGMRLARSDPKAEFIWLLNNDTVVDPGALDPLLVRMRADPSLGILGSCLLYYDRPDIVQCLGVSYNFWRARTSFIGVGLPSNKLPDVAEIGGKLGYVGGASIFLPVCFLNDVGEMSEEFFLYFEELDWAMRLKGKYKQSICLESHVYHKEGSSIGSSFDSRPSVTSRYYLGVNLLRFTAKHAPLFLPFALWRISVEFLRHIVAFDREAIIIKYMILTDFFLNRRRRGLIQI